MTDFLASFGYETWILHALVWGPLAGMVHVLAAPKERAKHVAFRWSLLFFVLSSGLWWAYDPTGGGFDFASSAPWIPAWGVEYALGLDGISLFMVILTTFTTPIAILGSFEYVTKRRKAFYALMLLLETGVVGVFLATDLVLFYVFFELTLVPMYFIVGIWGGARRIYAAVKFFLYTAVGSLLMLVAILYMYFAGDSGSFSYDAFLGTGLSLREQLWLFAAFALAFGIKVPVFPLHTWLPDAHVEAPTPGSVILAAVLLKMGTYGFLRFLLPFFPEAAQHPVVVAVMLTLGTVGIVYAAWVAAVQPDAKKLVAYTSVAHMGFVVIGVFALTVNGLQGGLVVMISHGVSTGALFLLLGMMYERRRTRLIEDFGGIGRAAPFFATAFVITALASIGLPGTSGFVGEFLALLGAFETQPVAAIVATTGVVFAAYYMLPMVQRLLFNPSSDPANRSFPDLSRRETAIMAPLLALMIWIGVHPTPFLERMGPSVDRVLERVEGVQVGEVAPIGAGMPGTAPAGTVALTGAAVPAGTEDPALESVGELALVAAVEAEEQPSEPATAPLALSPPLAFPSSQALPSGPDQE